MNLNTLYVVETKTSGLVAHENRRLSERYAKAIGLNVNHIRRFLAADAVEPELIRLMLEIERLHRLKMELAEQLLKALSPTKTKNSRRTPTKKRERK